MYQELKEVWEQLIGPGSPFEVTETTIDDFTIKTYASVPPSLREIWLSTAAYGDRDYLVYEQDRWSYQQAHQSVASIANWLQQQDVGPGDSVAIAMRNFPEWMLTYWACVSTGVVAVGINAWWVSDELDYGLQDSKPKVIICDQERLERFAEIADKFPDVKVVGVRLDEESSITIPQGITPFSEVESGTGALPEKQVGPEDVACIFYTSGTTGRPKGAQLTHRGCVNNIMNIAFWATAMKTATAKATGVDPSADAPPSPPGAALIVTPLFHVTANNCVAHASTLTGGKLVHMYRWDAEEALKLIEREQITTMSGVPVMSRELLSHPKFSEYDTSSLQAMGGGGAPLQPDLVKKIDSNVKSAKPSTGYGMTETSGIITASGGDFFVNKPASCGRAMPTFEAKCVNENGEEVPLGQIGELWVKGAPVIKGYLNRPEATAESITDGWLHTGDVAKMDEDGFIYIVDRVKDMVLRGGENIYCAEVEAVLFEIEGVGECCVFAVKDDRLGEEVGAAIVVKPGADLSAEQIRDYSTIHMAKHKIPRYIWMLTEPLPRNANGKYLKKQLRDTLETKDAV